jgi:hypothetical protein
VHPISWGWETARVPNSELSMAGDWQWQRLMKRGLPTRTVDCKRIFV